MNVRHRHFHVLALAGAALIIACQEDKQIPDFTYVPPVVANHTDPLPAGTLRVIFADVGQGDGMLIQLGDIDVVVDTGTDGLRATARLISNPVELLVISHPHRDHFGGGADLIRNHGVRRVITNGETRGISRNEEPDSAWSDFERAVDFANLNLESMLVGASLEPADGLSLTVLATGSTEGGEFFDTTNGFSRLTSAMYVLHLCTGRSVDRFEVRNGTVNSGISESSIMTN